MKNRLEALYELQSIDTQLDELEELRGGLPHAVSDLEARMKQVAEEYQEKEKDISDKKKRREHNEAEIVRLLENQKKFKAELHKARNNKEYNALTKEIDHSEEQIKRFEKEMDAIVEQVKQMEEDLLKQKPALEALEAELKEKQSDLKKIIKANEAAETKLLTMRASIQKNVKPADYDVYIKIRKVRNGVAVVTVKRSACGGCHAIIPPQKQLEIKLNNKIFRCQHCGRIIVSHEVSESVSE